MMFLLRSEWIMIPAVCLCVFTVVYLWSDRAITFLHKRSLGQREEVIRLLDQMFVEVNHKQITIGILLVSFGLGILVFLLLLPNILAGLIIGSMVTIAGWSIPLTH